MEKRKERTNNLEETPYSQRTVLNLQRIMMKPSIFRYEGHTYLVPFLLISSLFFMWGFANIGGNLEDFKKIHFQTVKANKHFDLDINEQPFYQAETL